MNSNELLMAAMFLDMASEVFSSNGMALDLPESWTQQECDDFISALGSWNGTPSKNTSGGRTVLDFLAMSFLAGKLKAEALIPGDLR
jgi:hypothetical protein